MSHLRRRENFISVLIKNHTEYIWKSGGIAPRMLNLRNGLLYSRGESTRQFEGRKLGVEPRFVGRPTCRPVTVGSDFNQPFKSER